MPTTFSAFFCWFPSSKIQKVVYAAVKGLTLSVVSLYNRICMENTPAPAEEKKSVNQIAYSRGEEKMNIITHLVGTVLAVAATVFMLIKVCTSTPINALAIVAVSLFSLSLINLYLMSTLYHFMPLGKTRRAVFRRFDHCSIAFLIAGTYAPYMLIGFNRIGGATAIWGIVIASVVLGIAVLVIVFNGVSPAKFRVFNMVCYVLMGWCCVIRADKLIALGWGCFGFLLAGGVLYTVGVVFYRIKRIKFNHAIWHLFVLAGSALHFVSIYCYLL